MAGRLRLVVASANPDKVAELQALLSSELGELVELVARPDSVGEIEETGETLEENARLKAVALRDATGDAALADDTGLEVEALGGAPGVYAARYAGENATYAENVEKLLHELAGRTDRRARFRTVCLVALPDGSELVGEGSVEGTIAAVPRGENGFGYDPVFVADADPAHTYAELSPDAKHALSHRAAAVRAVSERLRAHLGAADERRRPPR